MYTSSDIKTLFGRFGGDATGYREIRMENEAQEARDRWPLLGMIDLRRPGASATERSRSQPTTGAAGASGVAATAPASSAGSSAPPEHSQAALRRTAPLFARSPRRDVAQTFGKAAPAAPGSSQFRFSPPPGAQASPEVAAPPMSDEPVAVPQAAPRTFAAPPPFVAKVPPAVAVPAPSPPLVAPPAYAAGGAPLRKLFGAVSVSAGQQGQQGQQGGASAPPAAVEGHLDQLFDRLRVASNPEPVQGPDANPKAAPWISRGVSGP